MEGKVSERQHHGLVETVLHATTSIVAHHPVFTLLICLGLAGAAAYYTQSNLSFKTSRADLIDPRTDYHQRWINYTREFGDVTEDMVVVIEADDPTVVTAALDDLGERVTSETNLFKNVLFKVDLSQLRQKALQYSTPEQLQMLLMRLDEFSPLLKRFEMLTLRKFIRELRVAVEHLAEQPAEVSQMMAEPIFGQLAILAGSLDSYARDQRHFTSPWQAQMPAEFTQLEAVFRDRYLVNEKGTMGFLKTQPTATSSDFNGSSPSIDRLRELLVEVGQRHPEAKLALTGIPILESDEMRSSQTSMFYASILSFVGVAILMVMGFKGLRYPILGNIVLIVGMAWSFGFTTFAVGHLNILSVSFAAMLIGIGIDYSTVYMLRYLECRHEGLDTVEAVIETGASAGPGILTAAISSSVAFFCAMLTDFAGVAELGAIAGGGILICTVAAFVVLPAVLVVADRHRGGQAIPKPLQSRWLRAMTTQYPGLVIVFSSILIGGICTYAFRVTYDYNLLHLQADGLESVEVQKRIFEQSDNSLLFAVCLADSPQQVLELKEKFESLPTVHHVEELAAILPRQAPEDTQLLVQAVNAQLATLPARAPSAAELDPSLVGGELEKIEKLLSKTVSPMGIAARQQISRFLDRLSEKNKDEQIQMLRGYQSRFVADLLARLHGLASISATEPVSPADLTPSLVDRFVSPKGKWLLQVYPKSQIWDIKPLENFINDVRSVDPEATGTPLQTYEASKAIKNSYETAGMYALIAVTLMLIIDFRNLRDCILALLTPIAGTAVMFGVLGLCDIPLNPANLIVLPLVVGLGVDGGVHVIHDFRSRARFGPYKPSASVINAMIVNATTTMVGFGSMMIAAHQGLYSLGLVLTIGVGTCLVVSIVLVPAILTVISRGTVQVVESTTSESSAENAMSADLQFPRLSDQSAHEQGLQISAVGETMADDDPDATVVRFLRRSEELNGPETKYRAAG
ncbi:MAG: MMPL family transporter [Planctomycetes bacterium]|nr:MMPL family transporter [Planctomycetota bacterium]